MPTTTNFSWTTPADTDYVKDGASAIRTLANGIDASMAQLKGGTTGQILSKTNGTDMAFTWINNDQGDITAVVAGNGLSGGATSGSATLAIDTAITADLSTAQTLTNKKLSDSTTSIVDATDATKIVKFDVAGTTGITGTIATAFTTAKTVTIPDATDTLVGKATTDTLTNKTINGSNNTITNVSLTTGVTGTLPVGNGGTNLTTYTTGDLPYASATNTLSKLAVGTSGQVLTVASGVPTWATPSGSSFPAYSVHNNATQTFTQSVWTKVSYQVEDWDTDNCYASNRFTPTKAGYYLIHGYVYLIQGSNTGQIGVYKNGTMFHNLGSHQNLTSACIGGSTMVYANGSTDYFEIYVLGQGSSPSIDNNDQCTYSAGTGIRS